MNERLKAYLDFIQYRYDVRFNYYSDSLIIRTAKSEFKLNLTDGKRFKKYAIYHRLPISGARFHKQEDARNLYWGLHRVCTHDFNTINHIRYKFSDYEKFLLEFERYYNEKTKRKRQHTTFKTNSC